jgi:hypothetical protein
MTSVKLRSASQADLGRPGPDEDVVEAVSGVRDAAQSTG